MAGGRKRPSERPTIAFNGCPTQNPCPLTQRQIREIAQHLAPGSDKCTAFLEKGHDERRKDEGGPATRQLNHQSDLESDLHIRKHSTGRALHDGHLSRAGARAERVFALLARLGRVGELVHLDAVSHFFPSDARDAACQRGQPVAGGSTHLTTPALATEANGTSRPRICFALAETRRWGTRRVRDTARRTEVAVAAE